MPLKFLGRPKRLQITIPAVDTKKLQQASAEDSKEMVAFMDGDAQVNSHYEGPIDASITVQISDLAVWTQLAPGTKCTALVLTYEAASDSAGAAVGQDMRVSLSTAIVESRTGIEHANENKAPAVPSVTFRLSRFHDAVTDPTIAFTAA